jgi:hypothetical protein
LSSRSYYTLLASLPGLPPHYDVERPPISWPRLIDRLKMLAPEDAAVVDQWLTSTNWDRQVIDRKDEEIIQTYQRLMQEISNPVLREMILTRMNTRTIIAAIRHRRAGLPAPTGVGSFTEQIHRNYQHPQFNLHSHFDWIGKLDQAMAEGDALAAQRLLFEFNYRTWTRMSEKYEFTFETVLFYLARWEIIDRWTTRDAEAGRARFETMISETLGEYAHLFK